MTASGHLPPFVPDDGKLPGPTDSNYKFILNGPPIRTFLDGSEYWAIELPSVRIGLGRFNPGLVWSEHAGAQTGIESKNHIGIIYSEKMAVKSADGSKIKKGPGVAELLE